MTGNIEIQAVEAVQHTLLSSSSQKLLYLNFTSSKTLSRFHNFAIPSSMKNQIKLAPSLLLLAGALGFVGANPAKAADCVNGGLGSLTTPCTKGGFTFTLLSFTGFGVNDGVSISNPSPDTFTFSLNGNPVWSGSKTLTYSIAAPTGKLLYAHTSSLGGVGIGSDNATFAVTGTSANTATSTMTNGITTPGLVFYTPLSPETFTATLNVTSGFAGSVLSSYGTVNQPPVPGPIPILGAGAAFGFSRKLRRRIKLTA